MVSAALIIIRRVGDCCDMLLHYEKKHSQWGSFSGKSDASDASLRETAVREFAEEWRLATGAVPSASTVGALRSGVFHQFEVVHCKMTCFLVVAPPALLEAVENAVGSSLQWAPVSGLPSKSRFPVKMQASNIKKQWGRISQKLAALDAKSSAAAAGANPPGFPF